MELLEAELLPTWRHLLPGSRMVELVEMYVAAAQPLAHHGKQLLAAWRTTTRPEPTADTIASTAAELHVTRQQAEQILRFWDAVQWEDNHSPGSQHLEAQHWKRLFAVQSTIAAALTGDTEH